MILMHKHTVWLGRASFHCGVGFDMCRLVEEHEREDDRYVEATVEHVHNQDKVGVERTDV